MKAPATTPVVVQYLYVHDPQESFYYPTARAGRSAARVAQRYLECALTQAATLAVREIDCELVLAINATDRAALGDAGVELLESIERLGTTILPTPYTHRSKAGAEMYVSSRYLLDAVISSCAGLAPERQVWLTDLDCVWVDPERVLASAPAAGEVGCVYIQYPPDWNMIEFEAHGSTRNAIGELARALGAEVQTPPWVGGELLTATPATLLEMVSACEELDERLAAEGKILPNEEQILTLAGALGRVRFTDLSAVARRITTGPRSQALRVPNPEAIGLWHLPAEKGLSLRRTARQVRRGRVGPLRRDLADTARAARRFNVAGTGRLRRLRDDAWLAAQRMRSLRPGSGGR